MDTVELAAAVDLCISCGVCKSLCPSGCISWVRRSGMYQPIIDATKCVKCGICAKACPGLSERYEQVSNEIDAVMGNVLASYNAWSIDPTLRHVSGSGGVADR